MQVGDHVCFALTGLYMQKGFFFIQYLLTLPVNETKEFRMFIKLKLLSSVPFAIEESSGIVSVMSPLQQYSRPTYEFEAVVTDGTLSLATNLTIHVAPPPRPTARRNTIIQFTIQVGKCTLSLLTALFYLPYHQRICLFQAFIFQPLSRTHKVQVKY